MKMKQEDTVQIELCKKCHEPTKSAKCRKCGYIDWNGIMPAIKLIFKYGLVPIIIGLLIPEFAIPILSTIVIIIKWGLIIIGTLVSAFFVLGIIWEVMEKTDSEKKTITKSQETNEEILELRKLLDQSLNAKRFLEATKNIGFKYVSEDMIGITMEGKRGSYMLAILQSISQTNIAVLVYYDKETNESTTLIDEGKRKF